MRAKRRTPPHLDHIHIATETLGGWVYTSDAAFEIVDLYMHAQRLGFGVREQLVSSWTQP